MSGMPSVSRILMAAYFALAALGPIRAEDCNGNGIDDLEDIRSAPLGFEALPVTPLSGFVRDIAGVDFDGDGGEDIAGVSESHSEVVVRAVIPTGWPWATGRPMRISMSPSRRAAAA